MCPVVLLSVAVSTAKVSSRPARPEKAGQAHRGHDAPALAVRARPAGGGSVLRWRETGKELAREFEPSAQAIGNCVVQAERDEGRRADGPSTAEREEVRRLRREVRRLREERDILAKATAWFARETVPGRSAGS